MAGDAQGRTSRPNAWTESEVSLIKEVAELSWDSLERAQATRDLKRLNASLADQVAERTRELMQSEAQLRQSQKMEAVGQLAGGIAHDFNNLLTGIIGGLNLVRKRIARSDLGDVDRIMDAVEASANRAAALTKRMLAFSRLQPLQLRPVDVNEFIAAIADMLRRSIGENIELSLDMQENLCLANTNSNQLETGDPQSRDQCSRRDAKWRLHHAEDARAPHRRRRKAAPGFAAWRLRRSLGDR